MSNLVAVAMTALTARECGTMKWGRGPHFIVARRRGGTLSRLERRE